MMVSNAKSDLLGSIKADVKAGLGIISDSISDGAQLSFSKGGLLLKYLVITFVVAFAYVMLAGVPYMGHTIFIPLSLLILMFHYELLGAPASDRGRLVKNTLFTAVLLAAIFYLFTFAASPPSENGVGAAGNATALEGTEVLHGDATAAGKQENASDGGTASPTKAQNISGEGIAPPASHEGSASIPAIIASSLSIFLFALFIFMPVYMAKAGAHFTQAAKSSFKFISKNSMKTMSYVLLLMLSFSGISSLPAALGLAPLSALLFMLLGYAFFIFTYSFWERCRPA